MNKMVRILLLVVTILVIPFHTNCFGIIEPTMVVETPVVIHPVKPKVVLITLDGVRWQEVFNGSDPILYHGKPISARELLPNMYHYFVDNGMVVGKESDFIATGPMHISLPGYLEIMRGHPSTDCQSNECTNIKLNETMADLFQESAVIASWDTIKLTVSDDPDRFVINCGRNYRSKGWYKADLEEKKDYPVYWEDPEYRPDFLTEEVALDYLQYYSPGFLWISFGDTDEWAHANNYEKYLEQLKHSDEFIGQVIKMINSVPDYTDYTFVITADHGRGAGWFYHGGEPESARDWLMMYGRGIPKKGFVAYKGTKSLSNIKPTIKRIVTGNPEKDSLL